MNAEFAFPFDDGRGGSVLVCYVVEVPLNRPRGAPDLLGDTR